MSIGKNIAKYRKAAGLTQEELGAKLGVTNQAVSKWESQVSMPDVMLLPEIANSLGVTIYQLYGIDYAQIIADKTSGDTSSKIRAGVIGYGHIGKAAVEAINMASDFELVGVVSRSLDRNYFDTIPVVRSVEDLNNAQVVLLCIPSRTVPCVAVEVLNKGICTVDCFDIHNEVYELYMSLNKVAKINAVCAATAIDLIRDSILQSGLCLKPPHPRG